MKRIKGWKNTDKDLKCRGFQFEVGKKYHQDGEINMCGNGFHFHENRFDIFKFYDRESVVVEVEGFGEVQTGADKSVCSDIKIIRVLDDDEIKELCNLKTNTGLWNTGDRNSGDSNTGYRNSGDSNTGYRNSGDRNTGYSNTGYRNSGDRNSGGWNTGDRNTGSRNTGDWNKSDFNSGHFNTKEVLEIIVFNKPCKKETWDVAPKPNFIYFDLSLWISESKMTNQEKKKHPECYYLHGYLKALDYKEAWQRAWEKRSDGDLEKLEALPNFDWDVFTEISGIAKP